ncbi:MAG: hypothetical protein JNK12_10740 [Acidimicrobiales bacterium]|nr:hypothetical protein [Acidimicrobiales bacterium]
MAVATPAGAAPERARQEAAPGEGGTNLPLQNGWIGAPDGTATPLAALVDGAVVLSGGLSSGSASYAFTLPEGLRPAADVYLPVTVCGGRAGRLVVEPNGDAFIYAGFGATFADAQCFTSLDGASFTLGPASPVTLANTWTTTQYSTRAPKVSVSNGTVRFRGAVQDGSRGRLFVLPVGMRPRADVYVAVDLCAGVPGRLYIRPNGVVKVFSSADFSDAQCFTSLEGASFRLNAPTKLTLAGTWTGAAYGTRKAKAALVGGVVRFVGGVQDGEASQVTFLPVELRPSHTVHVRVDLCDAKPGRLVIDPTGFVSVSAVGGLEDASCFISLDGVSFVR